MRKGEALKIYDVDVHTVNRGAERGPYLYLLVVNVSPHSITRGVGAFAHESVETGATRIIIGAGTGKDFDPDAVTEQWFTVLDNGAAADAMRLGNTESGVFVTPTASAISSWPGRYS